MEILAIIPARSGSKSVIDKNIRPVAGKPMLAHSIAHAKASKLITRVIVSTDSAKYAEIAREYGAETPFLRPKEYATDTALDADVFFHALTWLKEHENYEPDAVVQLRPTYPIRNPEDIDAMIKIILSDESIDSVRSVAPAKEVPYKMWLSDETEKCGKFTDGSRTMKLRPLMDYPKECYNMPRQQLPQVYYQNACIDVLRTKTVLDGHSMSGKNIYGYVMDRNYDIDTPEDLKKAEEELLRMEKADRIANGRCRFVFDIDGVIAKLNPENNYAVSEPDKEMVGLINRLHGYGNEIILHTARGYVTGIDWSKTTLSQLKNWGLKYDGLVFGKPNATYYVDDRMLSVEELKSLMLYMSARE